MDFLRVRLSAHSHVPDETAKATEENKDTPNSEIHKLLGLETGYSKQPESEGIHLHYTRSAIARVII